MATGISLGRETYEKAIQYHHKIESFFLRTEGRRPSLSETLELCIRVGLEVLEEQDFDEVIQAVRERKIPTEIHERARQRKASVMGGLSDQEVEDMLKKAGKMK